MKILLSKIKDTLLRKPYLSKIFSNISWLVFDKISRMIGGLFIGAWISRYLGPELFGLQNYAITIMAILVSIAIFGLNSICVRNLVNHPENSNEILGSSFLIQVVTSIFSFSLLLLIVYFLFDDRLSKIVTIIIGLHLLFKPIDTIRYYFEAKTQSKYIVWGENISFIISSILKVVMILTNASFLAIIWIFFIDWLLTAIFIVTAYIYNKQSIFQWTVSLEQIKKDIKSCIPVTFAVLAITLYMRIDQVMLAHMIDYSAVGIYAAAIKISEVWYFIPAVITASVTPTLMEVKLTSEENYYKKLSLIITGLVAISLIIAIVTTFFAHPIIYILYGNAYQEATTVLIIHIWAGIFVALNTISGQWQIIENLQLLYFYRALFGVVINIIANLLLIPFFGIVGAAFATLISQICASFLFDLFDKRTRKIFWIKAKSLNVIYMIKELTKQIKSL